MWDGGWDDQPSRPLPGAGGPGLGVDDGGLVAPGDGVRPDGSGPDEGWPADDGPAPGRWYAPATRRGKIILVVVVAAVLVATLAGCLAGVDGLRQLRAMDLFDLI